MVRKNNNSSDTKKDSTRGKAWTFPKNSLEDAIRVAQAIEEKNAGNPMAADTLAKAVGFRLSSDWRFTDLLKSANLYGLVDGTGAKARVSLKPLGQDIVVPSSPQQRVKALFEAFESVSDFKDVHAHYGQKRIPEDEFFLNTLIRDFKVSRDRVESFADIFRRNLQYLTSFTPASEPTTSAEVIKLSETSGKNPKIIRTREFLDTCFVMMPFGTWFNAYYQEIYVPAIKEAGFEPVRGDELFTTGSVVEQIWEQITKSKVLLADLSGKNPNVFYELGLAHAAQKPVVFTASNIEDVPFDLRHLRVITYEIRETDWANKLRTNVTNYLRNAIKEPAKSIPHPFRPNGDSHSKNQRVIEGE